MTATQPAEPGSIDRARSVSVLGLRRRELAEVAAAARSLGEWGLPVPAAVLARIRELRAGTITVWVPCLCGRFYPAAVRVLPADVAGRAGAGPLPDPATWGGVPAPVVCESCDQPGGGDT